MTVDLRGRVAVITGGGGAIGSAMAKEFAKNGARVALADLKGRAQDTANEIVKNGGDAIVVDTDVSDSASARRMVEHVVRYFGALDVLVNNAGINGGPDERKPIHEYSDDLWARIIGVDLNGVYFCSKPAVAQMIKQKTGGSIINISSIVGMTPLRLQCAFAAAKAGVINLTKAMALELAGNNIRVNAIAPGSVLFEGTKELFYADPRKAEALLSHIPQKRPGAPEDIAAAACFLASDDSAYMTGSIMTIDGGWTCGYTRDF